MSHTEASKGEASTRSWIALVVALSGVNELSVADVAARLRHALLALRVGKTAWGSSLAVAGLHYGLHPVHSLGRHRVFLMP